MSNSRAAITKHISPNNPDLQTKECSSVQPYGESSYVTTWGEQIPRKDICLATSGFTAAISGYIDWKKENGKGHEHFALPS